MPEAVIVATARSPDRPRLQGSLKDLRPDDLTATIVRAALAKVPAARPARHRRPDARLRPARRRAGLQPGPGRRRAAGLGPPAGHHRHPLLLLVAADHPDGAARDQGGRGRRVHLGRCRDGLPLRQGQLRRPARTPRTRCSPRPRPAPPSARRARRRRAGTTRARTACCPTSTSRWARPPRTSPRSRASPAQDQDEFGVRSQNLAEKAIANGFWEREITPVTLPDGTVVTQGRRPARRASPWRRSPGSSRSSAPTARSPPATAARSTTAPPRWSIMSDTKARELGITPLARIVSTGVSGLSPEIMGYGPVEASKQALRRAGHDRSTTSTWSRSTRRSPPRSSRPTATWASTSTGSTSTAARSRSATPSA